MQPPLLMAITILLLYSADRQLHSNRTPLLMFPLFLMPSSATTVGAEGKEERGRMTRL